MMTEAKVIAAIANSNAKEAAASDMLAALKVAANWQTDTDPARYVTLRAIAQAEAAGIKVEADMAKDNSAAAGAAPFAPVQAGPTEMVGPITSEEYERRIARWYPHLVRR